MFWYRVVLDCTCPETGMLPPVPPTVMPPPPPNYPLTSVSERVSVLSTVPVRTRISQDAPRVWPCATCFDISSPPLLGLVRLPYEFLAHGAVQPVISLFQHDGSLGTGDQHPVAVHGVFRGNAGIEHRDGDAAVVAEVIGGLRLAVLPGTADGGIPTAADAQRQQQAKRRQGSLHHTPLRNQHRSWPRHPRRRIDS